MNKNKTFLAAALVALAASLPVHAATDYTRTRYPIVRGSEKKVAHRAR